MQTNTANLKLYFNNKRMPELIKIDFYNPQLNKKILCYRTHGIVPKGISCFKWTPCTRAMALFFVNAKIFKLDEAIPLLTGNKGSPASSLGSRLWKRDYAWIHDIFGTNHDGTPYMRQLIIGINIRQRMKVPIQLFLKTKILPVENITVFIDEVQISNNLDILKTLSNQLTIDWKPYYCKQEYRVSKKSISETLYSL